MDVLTLFGAPSALPVRLDALVVLFDGMALTRGHCKFCFSQMLLGTMYKFAAQSNGCRRSWLRCHFHGRFRGPCEAISFQDLVSGWEDEQELRKFAVFVLRDTHAISTASASRLPHLPKASKAGVNSAPSSKPSLWASAEHRHNAPEKTVVVRGFSRAVHWPRLALPGGPSAKSRSFSGAAHYQSEVALARCLGEAAERYSLTTDREEAFKRQATRDVLAQFDSPQDIFLSTVGPGRLDRLPEHLLQWTQGASSLGASFCFPPN